MQLAVWRAVLIELIVRRVAILRIGRYRLPKTTRVIVWVLVARLYSLRQG